ncbi:Nitroreductase [Xylariaceae sp. FL0255]|nr:Nitroreductase [Xylariaceae sp. FL0255]
MAGNINNLIDSRYGASSSTIDSPKDTIPQIPTNPALELILKHKSVRHFLPNMPLPPGTLEVLITAAQSAATSSHLQLWTAISITDAQPSHKARIATLCGAQSFINAAPLFLIFCADLHRLTDLSAHYELPGTGLNYTEMFLMASLDAGLAGQNAALAAESLGLGICYVGAVRNNLAELSEVLRLPDRVVPVFGLAVGVPDLEAVGKQGTDVKPRLPRSMVLRRETWDEEGVEGGEKGKGKGDEFDAYDSVMASFNAAAGRGDMPIWTKRSAKRVESVASLNGRHVLKETLLAKGFELR